MSYTAASRTSTRSVVAWRHQSRLRRNVVTSTVLPGGHRRRTATHPAGQPWSAPGPAGRRVRAPIPAEGTVVLRYRRGRLIAVVAGVYLLVPAVAFTIAGSAVSARVGSLDWLTQTSVSRLCWPLLQHAVLAHVLVLAWSGSPRGPLLVATDEGVWIRSRRWPPRLAYYPWTDVTAVFCRRWIFDHLICVHTTTSTLDKGLLARLDGGLQRALFDADLTASTFYSGRHPGDVLRDLRQLCGDTTAVDWPAPSPP